MRFVRYVDDGPAEFGLEQRDTVYRLSALPGGSPAVSELTNDSYLDSVTAAVENGALPTVDADGIDRLAPVPRPGKIVAVGLNYHDHAEEQEEEIPESPLLFSKAPTSVTNPTAPIVHPPGIEEVDYEAELAVVVGRSARNVDAADARDHIAGYTVLNDVSARDAQFGDGQFFRGKSYDTFAPMGPTLVAERGFDPHAADVETRVNGEVRQDSSTEQFVFGIDTLVEYISGVMTLRPGDVITTGTPAGVGIFRDPPELLEPGDTVTVEIDGIGALSNPVVDG